MSTPAKYDLTQYRDGIARAIFERRDSEDVDEWEDIDSIDREWYQCAADGVVAYLGSL